MPVSCWCQNWGVCGCGSQAQAGLLLQLPGGWASWGAGPALQGEGAGSPGSGRCYICCFSWQVLSSAVPFPGSELPPSRVDGPQAGEVRGGQTEHLPRIYAQEVYIIVHMASPFRKEC